MISNNFGKIINDLSNDSLNNLSLQKKVLLEDALNNLNQSLEFKTGEKEKVKYQLTNFKTKLTGS